jgi:xylitol oxidase
VGLHFTWIDDWAAVGPVLALVEERLDPFDPRPHWGKLFTASPAGRYERMPDFRQLRHDFDPTGKFGNDFLDANLS